MARVILQAGVREAIAGQLVSCYPAEGCGALVGRIGADGVIQIDRAVGIANVEIARGEDRYTLHPIAYAELEKKLAAQNDGTCIVGFFHSHPDGIAQPSKVDLEMAQGLYEFTRTDYVYAIQPVAKNAAGELTFWRLSEKRDGFVRL